jgi:hypothetical protein
MRRVHQQTEQHHDHGQGQPGKLVFPRYLAVVDERQRAASAIPEELGKCFPKWFRWFGKERFHFGTSQW